MDITHVPRSAGLTRLESLSMHGEISRKGGIDESEHTCLRSHSGSRIIALCLAKSGDSEVLAGSMHK